MEKKINDSLMAIALACIGELEDEEDLKCKNLKLMKE